MALILLRFVLVVGLMLGAITVYATVQSESGTAVAAPKCPRPWQ